MSELPLFDKMSNYVNRDGCRYHMPGHKGNDALFADYNIYKYDLTEVDGLDDYHAPTGVIQEAQSRLADLLSIDHAYFLVNGSSVGILSLIMGTVAKGDKIIIPRDCHKSVYHGVILSGAIPVYIEPNYNNPYNISTNCSYFEIEKVVTANADAKAMLIVNPNYLGFAADIAKVAQLASDYDIKLLIDQSHGAHLNFSDDLPKSAMSVCAYGVVEGWHKTMGSLTQTGVLALSNDDSRIVDYFHMLQSSSPSYLLMGSIDLARDMWEKNGTAMMHDLLDECCYIRSEIDKIKGITYIDRELKQVEDFFCYDSTKLVIIGLDLGLTGYELGKILRLQYNIEVEMSDYIGVTLMLTVGDTREMADLLVAALQDIGAKYRDYDPMSTVNLPILPLRKPVLSPANGLNGDKVSLSLSDSIGEISGEFIIPYPPGVPLVVPGELISQSIVDYMLNVLLYGGKIEGLSDRSMKTIKVINMVIDNE